MLLGCNYSAITVYCCEFQIHILKIPSWDAELLLSGQQFS